jgi:hypothetical protein
MRRPTLYAVRLVALFATTVVLGALFVPSAPANGPYTSAISDVALSSSFAAQVPCPMSACVNNACVANGNHKTVCLHNPDHVGCHGTAHC